MKDPCESCEKPIDPRWTICPYCETPQRRADAAAAPAPRAERRPQAAQPRARSPSARRADRGARASRARNAPPPPGSPRPRAKRRERRSSASRTTRRGLGATTQAVRGPGRRAAPAGHRVLSGYGAAATAPVAFRADGHELANPDPGQARRLRARPHRRGAGALRAQGPADRRAAAAPQSTRTFASRHYAEHAEKPFFGELVEFITGGRWSRRCSRGTRPSPRRAR